MPSVMLNGEPRPVAPGETVADVIAALGLDVRHVAVEVNLQLVPRTQHRERALVEGDRVEIVTFVGGG